MLNQTFFFFFQIMTNLNEKLGERYINKKVVQLFCIVLIITTV